VFAILGVIGVVIGAVIPLLEDRFSRARQRKGEAEHGGQSKLLGWFLIIFGAIMIPLNIFLIFSPFIWVLFLLGPAPIVIGFSFLSEERIMRVYGTVALFVVGVIFIAWAVIQFGQWGGLWRDLSQGGYFVLY